MILGLSEVSKTRVTRYEARDRAHLHAVRLQRTTLSTEQDADSHYEIRTTTTTTHHTFGSPLQPGARLQVNEPSSETTESILKFYSAKSIGTELSRRMLAFLGDLNVIYDRSIAANANGTFFPEIGQSAPQRGAGRGF